LSAGDFPICTLRPQAWKTGISEIMAIYQNQSNQISEFERMGCGWWKDWMLADGTIGKAYPYNLESHRPNEMKKTVKKIPRRIVDPSFGEPLPVKQFPEQSCYDRTVYNIGYLGEYKTVENFTENELIALKDKWENMMRRGYSQSYKNAHDSYDNVFVHQDWHSFEQFLRDIREIPQYFLAREDGFKGWDLDKDYYGSNAYSKNTCVFLKHDENSLYAETNGCYQITDTITNKTFYEINISAFATAIGSRQSHVQRGIESAKKFKQFTFTFLSNTDDFVYRYAVLLSSCAGGTVSGDGGHLHWYCYGCTEAACCDFQKCNHQFRQNERCYAEWVEYAGNHQIHR
jgi:hypothetical protein